MPDSPRLRRSPLVTCAACIICLCALPHRIIASPDPDASALPLVSAAPLLELRDTLHHTDLSDFADPAAHTRADSCTIETARTYSCTCVTWIHPDGTSIIIADTLTVRPDGRRLTGVATADTQGRRIHINALAFTGNGSVATDLRVATQDGVVLRVERAALDAPYPNLEALTWHTTASTSVEKTSDAPDAACSSSTTPPPLGSALATAERATLTAPPVLTNVRVGRLATATSYTAGQPATSGLLPPHVSARGESAEVYVPAYVRWLGSSVGIDFVPGSWYGAALQVEHPEATYTTTAPLRASAGLSVGGDSIWAATGEAMLGSAHLHMGTALEAGDASVWELRRLRQGGWGRPWRQHRFGVSLGSPDWDLSAFAATSPDLDEIVASTAVGGRYMLGDNVALVFDVSETSAIREDEALTHDIWAAPALVRRWGRADHAWLDLLAGTVLTNHVQDAETGESAASSGALLLSGQAGLEFEGRFARARHRISPSVGAMIIPANFTQAPIMAPRAIRTPFGLASLSLAQEVLWEGGWRLSAPVTYWSLRADGRWQWGGFARVDLSRAAPSGIQPVLHLLGCMGDICDGQPEGMALAGVGGSRWSLLGGVSSRSTQLLNTSLLAGTPMALPTAANALLVQDLFFPLETTPRYARTVLTKLRWTPANHTFATTLFTDATASGALARWSITPQGTGWDIGLQGAITTHQNISLFISTGFLFRE